MRFIHSDELLAELKAQSEAAHSRVTLMVDVDSTLLHVHTRNQATFRAFLTETKLGREASQAEADLLTLNFQETDWGWIEPLRRSGLEMSLEAREAMKQYWEEHFFSGRFLDKDIEFKGAMEFMARLLKETQVQIIYLTARDEVRMGESTRSDFVRRGWPLENRARLWLKPTPEILDAEFKAQALKQYCRSSRGEIYFIDNEPTVLRAAENQLSSDRLIWMDSVHSGQGTVNPSWRVLKNWL